MAAPRPTDSVVKVKEAIRDKLHDLTMRQLQQVEKFIDDSQKPANPKGKKTT